MVTWQEQRVDNGEISLAVFTAGATGRVPVSDQAPTVLLVHGWPDSHHLWTGVADDLGRDHRVIAYDARGFGASSAPDEVAAYRVAELADDLFAVVDAVSPDRPVHVVAHDWGSVHVWDAVTRSGAEERIASFTSISGPNLDQLGSWMREQLRRPTPRRLKNLAAQGLSSAYTVFFQLPVVPRVFFTLTGRPAIWRWFLRRLEGTPPGQVTLGDTLRADMISGLRYYRANIRTKLRRPTPAPTAVPVLEIVNTRDIALRPAIYSETHRYATRLWRRDSPTEHWLPYARPGYIADSVREFVSLLETGRPAVPDTLSRARVTGPVSAFHGRLAVITGAGSGIGRETAYALAAAGAEIVASDLDEAAAAVTAERCRDLGVPATAYRLDVTDTAAFEAFAATVRTAHGVPDIVINNAGIGLAGSSLAATEEQIDRLVAVNLRGVLTGSRLFGRQLVERGLGGHIVNLSSAAAFTPQRDLGLYAATKAAVLLFSESLRGELAEHRIGVSAICPGLIDTDIVANTPIAGLDPDTEVAERDRLDRLYQRRGFTPDRVARDILAAIGADKAVAPVTAEAKVGYRIYRFAPGLSRLGARHKVTEAHAAPAADAGVVRPAAESRTGS